MAISEVLANLRDRILAVIQDSRRALPIARYRNFREHVLEQHGSFLRYSRV